MDEPTKKSMSQRKNKKAAENHRPFSSAFSGTRGRASLFNLKNSTNIDV
jgi:hypothetical protein